MANDTGPLNEWIPWSKYVLKELEHNREDHRIILENQNQLRQEMAAMRVRAGVWGLVAGMIPAAVAIAYMLLK